MDVDTSTYPKAQPSNFLDTAGKLQSLESNALGITKQKLDLINTQFGLMNSELSTLANDPSVTKEQAAQRLTTFANTYKFPPQVSQHMLGELQSAPDVKSFAQNALVRGMQTQEKVNNLYGNNDTDINGQTRTPVLKSPLFGTRVAGLPIQQQNPPGTPTYNAAKEPVLLGAQPPQLPAGASPAGTGIPGQFKPGLPMQPSPAMAPNPTPGPSSFNDRFAPTGPSAGFAPGVAEAETVAGSGSGNQLAKDRELGSNFQRDIFPLAQAIPALEKLGTKGTGPGTETINNLKSFIVSNIPGVKESDFNGTVADYDKAKKYLTDFVNQTGSSGTNDKLAAAFAGNPSVGISNAAAVDVAKSAMALRRMKQAQLLEFEKLNLPASNYSKWVAQRTNQLDPRAFGVDMMNDEAKKKLLNQLGKNSKEKEKFLDSLKIAHDMEFITPSK